MLRNIFVVLAVAWVSVPAGVIAKEADGTIAKLEKRLGELIPSEQPSSIKETPASGIYEVVYGSDILYITKDAKYILQGDLIEVDTRKNITGVARKNKRKDKVAAVKDADTVLFAPKGKTKHTMTVFTDVDCPYCSKLHSEMQDLNDAGIAVRYMLYPRSGVGSPTYNKMVSVWCADDQKAAMTQAKNLEKIGSKKCDNPVQEHLAVGAAIGVSGTPAIVLEDGTLIPGYRPAKDLSLLLDQLAASQ